MTKQQTGHVKSKTVSPLDVSGPIRPTHGKGSVPAYGRAIHGANPSVKTVERKMAPPKSRRSK